MSEGMLFKRRTRNEHGEQKNKKWEQNLITSTLALSVTLFPILSFVPIFRFPAPRAFFSAPLSPYSEVKIQLFHSGLDGYRCKRRHKKMSTVQISHFLSKRHGASLVKTFKEGPRS